jgi:LmbE family N-acetylglucosaminyl deacetylase
MSSPRSRTSQWGIPAVAALTVTALLVPSPTTAQPAAPAVFFVPHQDDDVLMYGADLKNHVLAGRRTIAVLLTDGSSSRLCRPRYGENRAACAAARDLEFRNAMRTLGVTPVVWAARPTDGRLTERDVLGVMRHYLARFPKAALRAPTPRDPHHDHAVVGQALRSLQRGRDKRFYLKPSLWPTYPDLGRWVRRRNINAALNAYEGFGQLSQPAAFDEQYGGARASLDPTNYNRGGADSKFHR